MCPKLSTSTTPQHHDDVYDDSCVGIHRPQEARQSVGSFEEAQRAITGSSPMRINGRPIVRVYQGEPVSLTIT